MMKPYWTVYRARHVVAYLAVLRTEGEELRRVIHMLQSGIPDDARKLQETPETWEWLEARHWITFVVVDRSKQWLYVTDVESATIQ